MEERKINKIGNIASVIAIFSWIFSGFWFLGVLLEYEALSVTWKTFRPDVFRWSLILMMIGILFFAVSLFIMVKYGREEVR